MKRLEAETLLVYAHTELQGVKLQAHYAKHFAPVPPASDTGSAPPLTHFAAEAEAEDFGHSGVDTLPAEPEVSLRQ